MAKPKNVLEIYSREGNDLVLDGSGSFDEDEIPESEFPIRCEAC